MLSALFPGVFRALIKGQNLGAQAGSSGAKGPKDFIVRNVSQP